MPEQIIIENGLVKVVNIMPVTEVDIADWMPHIESRPPLTIGMLPKSAIAVHWDESQPERKRASFICETMPGMRRARYNNRYYDISLPWTYFIFDFITPGNPSEASAVWQHENSRIFWALEQVTHLDSMVGTALVPNCDDRGGICYGSTGVDVRLPIQVRIDRLVDEFYRTTFTHDSGTGSPWTDETGSTDWRRWANESARNHHVWRDFPEWTNGSGRITMRRLRDVVGERWTRLEPIQMTGTIPPLVEPMTFGRAEEWLQGVTPAGRHRLLTALQTMQTENPEAVIQMAATAAGVANPLNDIDPGIPVNGE